MMRWMLRRDQAGFDVSIGGYLGERGPKRGGLHIWAGSFVSSLNRSSVELLLLLMLSVIKVSICESVADLRNTYLRRN